MRIFVTGATGFIGSAVVRELVKAEHQVLGLVRSDASANRLAELGGEAHKGDLHDMDSLAAGVRACDGVVHLAFDDPASHDAAGLAASMEADRAAIAAIGNALAGTDRPFVGTSGTMVLAPGRIGTEDDAGDPDSAAAFRVPSENAVLALASRGVRASVVRPAPSVHGEGEHGFVPMLIKLAREKGVSAYVGDRQNRWPAVHKLDAAKLFALAVEHGDAGARYHAVGDEGLPFHSIAEAIGKGLRVPTVSLPFDEASGHFGPLAFIVPVDNPSSNTLTRSRLDWKPVQPGLLTDLGMSHYFSS